MKTCHNCMHWPVCNMREDDLPCGYYKRQENVAVKPQTNADHLRAMSDEDLAVFLGECKFCDICEEGCDYCTYEGDCDERLLDWLRQPVKDGDNE